MNAAVPDTTAPVLIVEDGLLRLRGLASVLEDDLGTARVLRCTAHDAAAAVARERGAGVVVVAVESDPESGRGCLASLQKSVPSALRIAVLHDDLRRH